MGRSGLSRRRGPPRDVGPQCACSGGKRRPRMSDLGPPAGRSAPPEAALSGPLGCVAKALWCPHTTTASAPCERAGERGELSVYPRRLVLGLFLIGLAWLGPAGAEDETPPGFAAQGWIENPLAVRHLEQAYRFHHDPVDLKESWQRSSTPRCRTSLPWRPAGGLRSPFCTSPGCGDGGA